MIFKRYFVAKIRDLGYTHCEQCKKVDIWRKKGSGQTHRVAIPRKERLSEITVRSILKQCKCDDREIESFLKDARA